MYLRNQALVDENLEERLRRDNLLKDQIDTSKIE